MGILWGLLLKLSRANISVCLEKAFKKFPSNKKSAQFYKVSYKVNPVYIASVGVVFICFSVFAMFQ